MDYINRKLFRVLACTELMQVDHSYVKTTKRGSFTVFVKGGRLRFFTLTVPESDLPLYVVASRFRSFANSRWWRKLTRGHSYICVYEPHPNGHGWHVHCLTNFYIPWQELDLHARAYMFGHTDIEAADSNAAFYVSKYLTKTQVIRRFQDSRHVRIVNVSRDLLPLYDILVKSPSVDYIRSHWERLEGETPYLRMLFLYFMWIHDFSGVHLWTPDVFERMYTKFYSYKKN